VKRIMLLAGIVGVLSIVALAIAETNEPDGPKDMAAQVKGLQKELSSLQSRLAKLEKQVSELANLMKVYPAPGVPKGWKPFPFNGRTYYCVPVKEKAATPDSPEK
jgi:hypothetical protein